MGRWLGGGSEWDGTGSKQQQRAYTHIEWITSRVSNHLYSIKYSLQSSLSSHTPPHTHSFQAATDFRSHDTIAIYQNVWSCMGDKRRCSTQTGYASLWKLSVSRYLTSASHTWWGVENNQMKIENNLVSEIMRVPDRSSCLGMGKKGYVCRWACTCSDKILRVEFIAL